MRKSCNLFLAATVAIGLMGCGSDNKTVDPKAPPDAPKLQPKTPSGGGPPAGGKKSGAE